MPSQLAKGRLIAEELGLIAKIAARDGCICRSLVVYNVPGQRCWIGSKNRDDDGVYQIQDEIAGPFRLSLTKSEFIPGEVVTCFVVAMT